MKHRLLYPIGVVLSAGALVGVGGVTIHNRTKDKPAPTVSPLSLGSAAPGSASRAAVHVDARRRQLIGVRTTRVARQTLAKNVVAVGIVRPDAARLMDVNLKMEGWLRDVHVTSVGQTVRAGQPLFTVYSTDLEALQTNFVGALRARDQTPVAQSADGSLYADRLVMTPRQRLKQLDVAEEELKDLEQTGRVPPATVFRAPLNGVVLESHAVRGMRVEPGQTLYRLADLSVVTVEADFPEKDAALLKTGDRAEVSLDSISNQRFAGTITQRYPYVSEETRTIKARIQLANKDGRIKPGMLATVEVHAALSEELVVPADALVDSGSEQIVFVSTGDGYFEPRQVKASGRGGEHVQIIEGLREGEEIATRAAFFLDSESRIRSAAQAYVDASPSTSAEEGERATLTWQISPNPPTAGDNDLDVRVTTPDGRPLSTAEVTVNLFMPAMPSMAMPAMHSDTRLRHAGDGRYRGTAAIPMAGSWRVTVLAKVDGRQIARTDLSLQVK